MEPLSVNSLLLQLATLAPKLTKFLLGEEEHIILQIQK